MTAANRELGALGEAVEVSIAPFPQVNAGLVGVVLTHLFLVELGVQRVQLPLVFKEEISWLGQNGLDKIRRHSEPADERVATAELDI